MEGKVVEVIERDRSHFIGTYVALKNKAHVITDGYYKQMTIAIDDIQGELPKPFDKVVVKVVRWPEKTNQMPRGHITSVLGASGSSEIEMKSILVNNGFELEFPQIVLEEANALTWSTEEELKYRKDYRDVPTFTIDPVDARDFDDALSLKKLENGNLEIGIHIADVTHFVRPDTELDKFAYSRSTSVYLVDRVLPMLPEKLSNELCSLRPNEEKCTFSALFTMDPAFNIIGRWFGKTLTFSDKRFTYDEAQIVLETGEGPHAEDLIKLNKIAQVLRKDKYENGAIDFESDEVRFKLDENGIPVSIFVKERKDAHRLVEDFMLLANREVATFISKRSREKEVPFVYRIHDIPDQDKVRDFALFAKELGYPMDVSTPEKISDSFNGLAKASRENDVLRILEPLAIRTMSKAIYSTDNIGHYGLAFDHYTHFTSPIRRYSDVLVHRHLEQYLFEGKRTSKTKLEIKCKHISKQERHAMDAERESIKYKQAEYISKHIGEIFEGQINGIIERGMFIELVESKCEGLIGFENFDEPFNVADSRLKATGLKSRIVYKMGDKIMVKIIDVDLSKRQIEMDLVFE